MKAIHHKLTDQEAMRQRLGFDPVEFMAEQRAKGLVTDAPNASSPAQPPAKKKGAPKKITSVKMEVVKTDAPAPVLAQAEFALDPDELTSANRQISETRLKLSLELLIGAAGANKRLLQNEDWQDCMARLTKLNQSV